MLLFSQKMVCVRAFFIKENTREKAAVSRLKIHRRKKAFSEIRLSLCGGRQRRRREKNSQQSKKQTTKRTTVEDLRHSVSFCSVRVLHHICGSFCAFPFRLFSPSSSFLHFCLVFLALVAPPVVLKTDVFSGKRIWRRKAERRGS